ncbi:MAG: cell division protein ZapA [Pseudomonadota bacterium]
MPEVTILIGGREFSVSCQAGEEQYLQAAAKMLDDEARVLNASGVRLPEAQMLLMAGLMLADKTASMEDKVTEIQGTLAERDAEIEGLRNVAAPEPVRVEVPVVPDSVHDTLADLAAQAEALAAQAEERLTTE